MEDLNAFAREVHENAVAHGWWEDERSFGEIIALCHSELSEALEEYRADRPMLWFACKEDEDVSIVCEPCTEYRSKNGCKYRGDKPEGIAVELADCIIRVLDWCGKDGLDIDQTVKEVTEKYGTMRDDKKFGEFIARMHEALSMASFDYKKQLLPSMWFAGLILAIYKCAERESVDMDAILRLKHEYNKGRSYRHGGKVI